MKMDTDNSSQSSPFKGDKRGASKGEARVSFAWQVADSLEYELLKVNAKENRRNMTDAESVFWQMAKGNGFGEKCRRQYVIGEFIVDFFFRKSMLIVEIDGGYHFTEEQQQKDSERQEWLEKKGYRVLRFTNEQVLFDIDNVTKEIKQQFSYEQQ